MNGNSPRPKRYNLRGRVHAGELESVGRRNTMKSDRIRISILALAIAGSVNAAPPENDTHLRTQTFVMALPGMWKRLPSNEAVV